VSIQTRPSVPSSQLVTGASPVVSPVAVRLKEMQRRYAGDFAGAVATYIPELAKADAAHFGIALATPDGEVYEAGDSRQQFTIQSISKPFVYGLALDDQGVETVLARVGVEPSGDPFNAIMFDERTNRPFNPMVNAGAIATTSLVKGADYGERMGRILGMLGRFAGRELEVDEAVYQSEKATGHRNRAIAYLELNGGMLSEPVDEHLDLYFRQCSVLVDARDLALMAATLANEGVNPRTGERAVGREHVKRILSVMHSCGMYDFSGEWGFRVGLPAKSGVGGGIVAVLPGQFGVGTFSPLLDAQGNSVRGIQAVEDLSRDFSLHLFDAAPAASAAIRASYTGATVRSKCARPVEARAFLEAEGSAIRVFELRGTIGFAAMEHVCRAVLGALDGCRYVVLDGRRVGRVEASARALLVELRQRLMTSGIEVLASGVATAYREALEHEDGWPAWLLPGSLDEALEWCEDRLLKAAGVAARGTAPLPLAETEVSNGMLPGEVAVLASVAEVREYQAGEVIVRQGEEADALYVLASGSANVALGAAAGGEPRRLGSILPGVVFGEVALFERALRTASVVAREPSTCYVIPVERLRELAGGPPGVYAGLLFNVARGLAERLRLANAEIAALEG
jgi:glutaminase